MADVTSDGENTRNAISYYFRGDIFPQTFPLPFREKGSFYYMKVGEA